MSKKRILAVLMAAIMAVALAACGGQSAPASAPESTPAGNGGAMTPGTYEGKAQGFGGEIVATVTVSESEITDALTQAGADIAQLDANCRDPSVGAAKKDETLEADIVIVGAGGAGMTAAISAVQAGKSVIVLEKMKYAGDNTTKTTGGMNAAETHYQAEQNITDSVAQFVEDTMEGGHNINDRALVTVMAQNSAADIDWLDEIGAPLPKVSFSGGATNARIHAPEDGSGVGDYIINALLAKMEDIKIDIMNDTAATELIAEDGKVIGVLATSSDANHTIKARAVIPAIGGFGPMRICTPRTALT